VQIVRQHAFIDVKRLQMARPVFLNFGFYFRIWRVTLSTTLSMEA